MEDIKAEIKLTQYSHGAGCGCKIAPAVLDIILKDNQSQNEFPQLLVGNSSRDDAAVYDMENGIAMISTTDFFMPIVDDPFDFGRIAATNAISDVYAMGGMPCMAVAILGWPIDKIPAEVAGRVVAGGRKACSEAGIPLAGGHSIDCPEPVFGLAVNGFVKTGNIKRNDTARKGDLLFLTKPLGVGAIATASKRGLASEVDLVAAVKSMTTLNKIGSDLSDVAGVHAMTDVTGFGLLGHLHEMASGSRLSAVIDFEMIPYIPSAISYIKQGCIPGGTKRNWNSYGHRVSLSDDSWSDLLCDPQTSGGLLVAVHPDHVHYFQEAMNRYGLSELAEKPIGIFEDEKEHSIVVR